MVVTNEKTTLERDSEISSVAVVNRTRDHLPEGQAVLRALVQLEYSFLWGTVSILVLDST